MNFIFRNCDEIHQTLYFQTFTTLHQIEVETSNNAYSPTFYTPFPTVHSLWGYLFSFPKSFGGPKLDFSRLPHPIFPYICVINSSADSASILKVKIEDLISRSTLILLILLKTIDEGECFFVIEYLQLRLRVNIITSFDF